MLSILECRNTEHEIKVHPEIRMSSMWSWAWLCCLHLPRAVPCPARLGLCAAALSVPAWFRISLWAEIGCFPVLFLCSCLFGSPAWAVYSALSRRQLVGNEESLCYLWQVYCFSCEEEPTWLCKPVCYGGLTRGQVYNSLPFLNYFVWLQFAVIESCRDICNKVGLLALPQGHLRLSSAHHFQQLLFLFSSPPCFCSGEIDGAEGEREIPLNIF